jgi:phage shock protein PspC (stress-responsive transcriptional regulator)
MARLRKNSENTWVDGILSGIGEKLEMSETAIDIMRIAFLLLTLCTMFPGLIIYIILMILIPED